MRPQTHVEATRKRWKDPASWCARSGLSRGVKVTGEHVHAVSLEHMEEQLLGNTGQQRSEPHKAVYTCL